MMRTQASNAAAATTSASWQDVSDVPLERAQARQVNIYYFDCSFVNKILVVRKCTIAIVVNCACFRFDFNDI